MEFLVAKCPNCGGELRLPDDKKQVKCMYCGFDVIVRDAVNAAGANVGNWLKLASTAEETGNYAEAYKYYTQVLEFEPDNYIAHLGKGISAGYLSTPYKFRAEEVMTGAEKAVDNAPDDKKQEIKLQASEQIALVCSAFVMDGESDESIFETIAVAYCLKMAHEFAPDNENIITSLYFHYRMMIPNFKLLNSRYQTDTWNANVNEYTQKANEYLSKLQAINPEKAADFIKSEKETEKSIQTTTGGSGCLLTIMCFILISTFLMFVLI